MSLNRSSSWKQHVYNWILLVFAPHSRVSPIGMTRVCKSDRMTDKCLQAEERLPSQPPTDNLKHTCFWLQNQMDTASYSGGGTPHRCCASAEVWLGSSPAQISSVFSSPQYLCPAFALMLSAQLQIRFQEMWAHGQGWNQTRRTENDQPRVTAASHSGQPKHSRRGTREPLCSKSRFREFISHGRNMTNHHRL